jgi:apolipoprotein N-acyltransferase
MIRSRAAASLGAGALVALAMPPWGWWPLAFVGVALHAAVARQVRDGAFWCGLAFAAGWLAPATGWMWFLVPAGWPVAVAMFAAAHGLAALLAARAARPWLAAPLLHALAEALRWSVPFGGVPLASLAIATASSPLAPVVRIGGPLLLTLLVLATGFAAAEVAARHGGWSLRSGPLRALAAAVFVTAAGAVAPHGRDTGTVVRVAAVQGGGPQGTLAIETSPREVVERHLAATRGLATDSGIDVVVWPENVVTVRDFSSSREREEIAAEAARLGAPILVGITERAGDRGFTNAQVVVLGDGTVTGRYDKVRRVPFGEYIPLRGTLSALGAPVDRVPRDAVAGDGPAVLDVAGTTMAVAISWEVFFPGRANEGVESGGTVVLNPTNGASYTGTILQTQQVAASRLRAIETGRHLVQVAPTGFSAFVGPDGSVRDRTGVSERTVIVRDVPLRTGRTIYSRTGDLPWIAAMVGAAAWLSRRRRLPTGQ